MKITSKITLLIFIMVLPIYFQSCKEEDESENDAKGKISFKFKHFALGQALIFDSLLYTNAAGNNFLVSEIQYFISKVILYKDGNPILLENETSHYVDTDLDSTLAWNIQEELALGQYDSINFTFGFQDEDNITGMFTNPPESNMFWPVPLGGGYHYMKLNGKWATPNDSVPFKVFNLHLGRGQIGSGGSTNFIDNSFEVNLNHAIFVVSPGSRHDIIFNMNIERWFDTPNLYNLDSIGGQIMQNQEAMNMAKENGHNVFSVDIIKIDE